MFLTLRVIPNEQKTYDSRVFFVVNRDFSYGKNHDKKITIRVAIFLSFAKDDKITIRDFCRVSKHA